MCFKSSIILNIRHVYAVYALKRNTKLVCFNLLSIAFIFVEIGVLRYCHWFCLLCVLEGQDQALKLTLPRLDARYDWLTSQASRFSNKTQPAVFVKDGCVQSAVAKARVAIVMYNGVNCSYAKMVRVLVSNLCLYIYMEININEYILSLYKSLWLNFWEF